MTKVYKRTGTIWENYSPDVVRRGIQSQPNFVGWSGCGPITLLIENVIGIIPDAANNTVRWTISRKDRHGLKNLHFGNTIASLECAERESIVSEIRLSVQSDKPFNLVVCREFNKEQSYEIHAGLNLIRVK